jgi:hypothetical protein
MPRTAGSDAPSPAISAAAAVFPGFVINYVEGTKVDIVIIDVLKALEYFTFFIDAVLYTVFLWRAAKRAIKNL